MLVNYFKLLADKEEENCRTTEFTQRKWGGEQIINLVRKAKKTTNRKISNTFHILFWYKNIFDININYKYFLKHKSRVTFSSQNMYEELKRQKS